MKAKILLRIGFILIIFGILLLIEVSVPLSIKANEWTVQKSVGIEFVKSSYPYFIFLSFIFILVGLIFVLKVVLFSKK